MAMTTFSCPHLQMCWLSPSYSGDPRTPGATRGQGPWAPGSLCRQEWGLLPKHQANTKPIPEGWTWACLSHLGKPWWLMPKEPN